MRKLGNKEGNDFKLYSGKMKEVDHLIDVEDNDVLNPRLKRSISR